MAVAVDEQDLRIVGLLLKDGRAPAAQIAEQIGLSRPAVADRIAKLEQMGVIRGTTVVVDPTALGREITAFIAARGGCSLSDHGQSLGRSSPESSKAFRDLMAEDEVLEVHIVAGEDCYFIKVRTDSIASLNDLVNRLTSPPLSLATRTTIVMETYCEKVGGITLGDKA